MDDRVRLDVWLDVACLFKTRSEAQHACKLGRVTVNGVVAKPHRDVRAGDRITLIRPDRKQQIVVVSLADKHVPKAEARALYEDHTPPPTAEELAERRLHRAFHATTPTARLDRRARRDVARGKFRA